MTDIKEVAAKIAQEVAKNCGSVPQLTFPHIYLGLKEFAAALANETKAEPARKLTYEDADEIPCPHCEGTGTEISLSGGGPDAYDVEHDCSHCAGNQTLGAAYRTLIQDLKAAQKAHTDACARLYAAPQAEQPGAMGLSERRAYEAWAESNWDLKGADPFSLVGELFPAFQAGRAAIATQPVAPGWSEERRRREAGHPERQAHMSPPEIITFECAYRIGGLAEGVSDVR